MNADTTCHGNQEDHCCYVDGEACRYLVENVNGRRWACGLYIQLGSWDEVHAHEGYIEHVQSVWDRVGIESCGEWGHGTNQCCYAETDVVIN